MTSVLVSVATVCITVGCGARRTTSGSEAPAPGATDDRTTKLTGSASGTAFWLGPIPAHRDGRPLHFGDAHESDWEGADDADVEGLEDVVISAIPVRNDGAASPAGARNWPETGALTCGTTRCPAYVTVATGDRLELFNYTRKAVSWHLVKDGRVRSSIGIYASRTDPPALLDISGLEPGVYEIIERGSTERRGWMYRAASDEIVVGPTSGNSRYSIALTPGSYRVVAWHPHLASVEKPVDIRAGAIKRVNPVFAEKNLRD